jgi:hypothetical protein
MLLAGALAGLLASRPPVLDWQGQPSTVWVADSTRTSHRVKGFVTPSAAQFAPAQKAVVLKRFCTWISATAAPRLDRRC